MSIYQYAGLCVTFLVVGAFIAIILKKETRKSYLQDILSFSGAFLFGMLILELFPSIYHEHNHTVGVFILIGFFLQIGMDYFTKGVEHGHLHIHAHSSQPRLVFSLFFGLGIHALMDGLPFVGLGQDTHGHFHSVYGGILLHKIAEGFTLFMVLDLLNFSRTKSFVYIIIFSMITPIGMILIQNIPFLTKKLDYVLAFAGGSLLHVAITILFELENVHHHGISWRKLLWIVLGISAALLILLL